ncbi:MAG: glycosyltransferase [Planctomycetales bacterium]|nr:glycosyltransferase [Planctomycetales bacterium]
MLTDWIHWLSSIRTNELILLVLPLLLLDGPRYTLGMVGLWMWDFVDLLKQRFWPQLWLEQSGWGEHSTNTFDYCPEVCVIVAGLNEAETVGHTLESMRDTYPRMEIVVVDDGSDDNMTEVARAFAEQNAGVMVLSRKFRGGKSSALNYALPFTQAEIIVCVDGDSHLQENAIWEIVQPFVDPQVAAVSGTVVARNPFVNATTWLQALEYLKTIFLGRMLASRLNMLAIVSGAFGAYRREPLARTAGWDVGPGEDGDLSLRLRKMGYRIVFAPYAQCLTNLPTSFWRLIKQRRRWEWAIVTFECRKHIDLVNIFSSNFRWSNLFLVLDRWLFGIVLQVALIAYIIYAIANPPAELLLQLSIQYACFVVLEYVQLAVILYYSLNRRRDAIVGLIAPVMPFYHLFQRFVSLYAVIEEMVSRRSFRDTFVPEHVRDVTWHW